MRIWITHKPIWIRTFLTCAALSALCATAAAAPMTNEDVIQLAKAGLDDNVILETFYRAERNFDLTTTGILKLKEAGLSNAVIVAMLTGARPSNAPATVISPAQTIDPLCTAAAAGVITLRSTDGEKAIGFKRGRKETESSGAGRALASVFTFGIVKMSKVTQFAILTGLKAETRSKVNMYEFLGLAIERGQSPSEAIKLVSFDEGGSSPNYARVLPVGEGSVSYWGSVQGTLSHAPLEKYTRPIAFEKLLEDCIVNGRSVTIWAGKPLTPIPPGEYAIFLEPDRYHDFSVEDTPKAVEVKK